MLRSPIVIPCTTRPTVLPGQICNCAFKLEWKPCVLRKIWICCVICKIKFRKYCFTVTVPSQLLQDLSRLMEVGYREATALGQSGSPSPSKKFKREQGENGISRSLFSILRYRMRTRGNLKTVHSQCPYLDLDASGCVLHFDGTSVVTTTVIWGKLHVMDHGWMFSSISHDGICKWLLPSPIHHWLAFWVCLS